MAPGQLAATIPGCSGTRTLADNLSDLRAQIAANTKGISLVGGLIGEYGLEVVQAYMGHIQAHAELAVRSMLKTFSEKQVGRSVLVLAVAVCWVRCVSLPEGVGPLPGAGRRWSQHAFGADRVHWHAVQSRLWCDAA